MRKKILFSFLLLPIFSFSQNPNKPFLEVGAFGGIYPKTEALAYGGTIGINGHLDKNIKAGVGFMPLLIERSEKPQLPLYGDLRIRLNTTVDLMLQPGYNLYKEKYATTVGTSSVSATTKGGFYGAAGFAFNFPTQTNAGLFVQVKYNYFEFEATTRTTVGRNTTSASDKGHNNAVTLGVGVRLQ